MPDDLELKDLGQFYGTQQYYKLWMGVTGTDGVNYIMQNGYSWFVTDMCSVIATEFKDAEFLTVKLEVNADKTARAAIEDGNGKVLYSQDYKYTDAKRNLTLFCCDNVLMLSGEY